MEKSTYKELSDELRMLRGVYKELRHIEGSIYKNKLVVRIRALDSQLKEIDSNLPFRSTSGGDYNPIEKGSFKYWIKYLHYRLINKSK